MPKILVTGGAGFIGSALVNTLLQLGNEVVVIDISNIHHDAQYLDNGKLKFVRGNILDRRILKKVIDACDMVYHLAANPDVRVGFTDSKIDYEQNLLATYTVLEAMKESSHCKKIIFTSSSTVYGEPKIMPTPEKYAPLFPVSLYGATKLACEAIISGYCHMFNLSGVALRLANVAGPTSTHGVIYDFMMKLLKNSSSLEVLGDGQQNKSYLYIDDCVNALLQVSKIEGIFDVFNAGSPDRISVSDIAAIVISELSLSDVKVRFTGGIDGGRGWKGDAKEMLLDNTKLETLGWKAKYGSKEAVTLSTRGIIRRMQKVKR